jgi:hypothetical protein
LKSSDLTTFLDVCTPQEKAKLDVLFARAIYSTATPFHIVENHYWIEFFRHLRPAYKLPSRHCISNPLLNKEYELMQEEVNIKMQAADALTLVSDGWTDNTGNSIINVLFCTPKPFFFKSVTSNCESHTGEYISNILIGAIDSVGHKKICAVVTDNAANMKNAWKILQEKYPYLIIFGCLAHGINLLIKDILGIHGFDIILKDVKDIIKFFKNRQLPREMLKQNQIENGGKPIALSLAVDTRWGSNAKMLESLLKCRNQIEAVTVNKDITKIMPTILRRTILDVNFWFSVENIQQLLKVPSDVITNLEGDSANLSYVHDTLNQMEKDLRERVHFLEESYQDQIMIFLKNRREFISHPSQLAARYLNCKLRKNPLTEEEENEAIDFIIDLGQKLNLNVEKLYADIGEYNAKVSLWGKDSLMKAADLMDPTTWWKGLCGRRELSKIAVILLSIPATAAASERNWSCFGNIKTQKRNRLTKDTLMKLVFIKFNLNICKDMVKLHSAKDKRYKKQTMGTTTTNSNTTTTDTDTTDSNSNEVLHHDETDEIQSIGSTVSTSEVEEIFLQFDSGASDSDE